MGDLINRGRIIMNNTDFKVEPLHQIHKRKNEDTRLGGMRKAVAQDSPNNIMNCLNDDCLRLIFERIDHLADFVSIVNVCKRFKQIGEEMFPSKIRQKWVRFDELVFQFNYDVTVLQIANFLRIFGSSVLSVKLEGIFVKNANTILKMMNKYCTNIRNLEIEFCGIEKQTLNEIELLLSKLRHLHISVLRKECGPFVGFVTACTQLETLEINGRNFFTHEISLPAINFQHLISFSMRVPRISINAFLLLNTQIEILEAEYSLAQYSSIASEMSNVRKIKLKVSKGFSGTDAIHFQHLQHMEVHLAFKFDASIINIVPMTNVTKVWLDVKFFFDENILIGLTQKLPEMNELTINFKKRGHKITQDLLKKVLQKAKQLQRLNINLALNDLLHIEEEHYNEMIEIQRNRSNSTELTIDIKSETDLYGYSMEGYKRKLVRFKTTPKLLTINCTYIKY